MDFCFQRNDNEAHIASLIGVYDLLTAEAFYGMVVDHACCLHVGVADG